MTTGSLGLPPNSQHAGFSIGLFLLLLASKDRGGGRIIDSIFTISDLSAEQNREETATAFLPRSST